MDPIDLKLKILTDEKDERKLKKNKFYMHRRVKSTRDKIEFFIKCKINNQIHNNKTL